MRGVDVAVKMITKEKASTERRPQAVTQQCRNILFLEILTKIFVRGLGFRRGFGLRLDFSVLQTGSCYNSFSGTATT